MLNSTVVYHSNSYDPAFNLAFEEYLLKYLEPHKIALFLWQSENAIVIGRHQNPHRECDLPRLKQDGVKLVRRLSGGGSVYHDLGNLNFTFVTDPENYDVDRQLSVILEALAMLGVQGEQSGRNDLTAEGQKFSGNAFLTQDGRMCHHGTVLIDVNLEKLSTYLTVSKLKIKSKGIDSVRARVVNLKELSPEINVESLKKAIQSAFNQNYAFEPQILRVDPQKLGVSLNPLMEKYNSWDWNYAEGPSFEIEKEAKFDWGVFEIRINCKDNLIEACEINTDCLIEEDFERLQKQLIGEPFTLEILLQQLNGSIHNAPIKSQLSDWFREWLT